MDQDKAHPLNKTQQKQALPTLTTPVRGDSCDKSSSFQNPSIQ
jgi:hypothetical protein